MIPGSAPSDSVGQSRGDRRRAHAEDGSSNISPAGSAAPSETASRSAPGLERHVHRRLWSLLELITVFAVGVTLMNFFYIDPRGVPADQIAVPGFDSFYHVKMAAMLPDVGLVKDFPWLRHVHFSPYDDSFVSHHYGFHVLLMPFVKLAQFLYDDALMGGRWAISFFFGMNLLLLHALLMIAGIRWRWMWLIVFLLLPSDFFGRHAFVRAISPSLMFMLLILLAMFKERPLWCALAIVGYTHLYLGSVVYTPVIVGCYALASLLGPRGDRRFPWPIVLWATLGWLAGLRTYPYFSGALEFLRLQILGSGLNPDISVGGEWSSYTNVWDFGVKMCGPLLGVWCAALIIRLRRGGRLDARELTLVLLHFAFLFLTLKAKRFVEYWPAFCLLSAAYMAGPKLSALASWFDPLAENNAARKAALARFTAAIPVCAAVVAVAYFRRNETPRNFLIEWPIWTILATALLMTPLTRLWSATSVAEDRTRGLAPRLVAALACGAVFGVAATLVGRYVLSVPQDADPKLHGRVWGWVILGIAYVGICFYLFKRPVLVRQTPGVGARLGDSVRLMSGGMAIMAVIALVCSHPLAALQRNIYCGFDLPAIRDMMGYLKEVSEEGDVVFTDDWDVFPVYFYHNSYNHYIVGLDPKFTHSEEPELWERYVKITRGQVPRTFDARWTGYGGIPISRRIHARVEDIRDYFHARYVITDRDHKALAQKLAEAGDFAELIYPKSSYRECSNAPYLIFRVKEGQTAPLTAARPDADSTVFLSDLEPALVRQGWGELQLDRSVSDEPIHLGKRFYPRGLGTHAPLELAYDIPRGCDTFEAVVGINRSTDGQGSVIASVEVDGREVFRSPALTGESEPVVVSVSVAGAKRLTLRADATPDGNRWDHVDWAMARLIRKTEPAESQPVRRRGTPEE